jgi:hypothetical protein
LWKRTVHLVRERVDRRVRVPIGVRNEVAPAGVALKQRVGESRSHRLHGVTVRGRCERIDAATGDIGDGVFETFGCEIPRIRP